MCGISGLFSFENFKKTEDIKGICDKMLLDIEIRGSHASGISVINTNTNKIKLFKSPQTAKDFIKENRYKNLFKDIHKFNLILLHTRYSTNGNPLINRNNHPFKDEKHRNVLIHNGIVTNYEDLKNNKKLNLVLKTDCDSEVILSLFNQKNYNLTDTIKQLRGSFAIALYNQNKLYLYSNKNPLYLCFNKTKDLFLFSSHKNIFSQLFNTEYKKYYNLFKIYDENKNDLSIISLDDEDLIKINFKNKSFKQSIAELKTENYYKIKTIEDFKTNEEEVIKKQLEIISTDTENPFKDYNEEYFKQLENENTENFKIHRKPLSYSNTYNNYDYVSCLKDY